MKNDTMPTAAETQQANILDKDSEEPPSWRGLWQKLRQYFAGKADAGDLREAVESLIEDHAAEKDLPAGERALLTNILQVHDCTAADCMMPRANIIAVDVNIAFADLVKVMTETQHSRLPVYRETLDDILGMVHMKDVLACLAQGSNCMTADLLRQVLFVPPSTPALRLLQQMRSTRHYMALVVDEFGGIDGLVTIEDLLEEIVGEIDDEHDEIDEYQVIARADGTLVLEARMPIEDFEERVGPILAPTEREEVDTVGGLVFLLAGRMPRAGENFVHEASGISFDVLEVGRSRILRLRVRNLPNAEAKPAKLSSVGA
jgi:magnesium and cobalt transporter